MLFKTADSDFCPGGIFCCVQFFPLGMSGTKFCVTAMLASSFTICSASEIVTELNEYIILYLKGKELSLPTDTVQTLIVTRHQRRKRVTELHMHVSLFSLLYTIQDTISSLAINDTILSLLVNSAV